MRIEVDDKCHYCEYGKSFEWVKSMFCNKQMLICEYASQICDLTYNDLKEATTKRE